MTDVGAQNPHNHEPPVKRVKTPGLAGGFLHHNKSSCIRPSAEHRNHVWSYDFVEDRLTSGRRLQWVNIIHECTRERLASIPGKSWRHTGVISALFSHALLGIMIGGLTCSGELRK